MLRDQKASHGGRDVPRQQQFLEALNAWAGETPAAGVIRHDPLSLMAHTCMVHERLCDLLEAIADALPDGVSCEAAETASLMLRHQVRPNLILLSEIVIPAAIAPDARDGEPDGITEAAVLDLAEALERRHADDDPSAETLGALLRAFLAAQRRSITWQADVLLPQARAGLSAAALAALGEAMVKHRLRTETVPITVLLAKGEEKCRGNCADCKEKREQELA
jgi:hypothetical protein